MINYQIINGNYTFINKLEKRSVENIILTGLSDSAYKIFKSEARSYKKRSILALYSMCKHYIPNLTIKTFEKVLGKLMHEKKIFCVYCPEAQKYVFGSSKMFSQTVTGTILRLSNNAFLKNHYCNDDKVKLKLDGVLEEDIERLIS